MAIKMVREPSDTPNINNIDDIVPMRYAYGGQNGYVIGKGTEISNTINGTNFIVNSGRLVIQGVECDIDATGVTITVDNIATKRYYTIYLQVNLATNQVIIDSKYDTADYPVIDSGDDLTENSSGTARMVLYKFTAQNGVISEVNKVVESIKYIKDVKVDNAINADNVVLDTEKLIRRPLTYTNNQLIYDNKSVCISEILWSGKSSLYTSNSITITLTAEQINSLNIGDVIEILFTDLSNGDVLGSFGCESKLIFMPIAFNPKTEKNGTIEILDVSVSDSRISKSLILMELNGNNLTIKKDVSSKIFTTTTGGGVISMAYVTKVSVIRKKEIS